MPSMKTTIVGDAKRRRDPLSVASWLLPVLCCSPLIGCDAEPSPDPLEALEVEPRFGAYSGDFTAHYVDCDEFAGVGVVPLANVVDLVPDDYTVVEPFPGAAIVVAQAGSCASIQVSGHEQPGIFAQFGVAVVPPLDPGNGDFYQVLFATDDLPLALELWFAGVPARFSPNLSYEIDETPELSVDVPKPPGLAFTLEGPITLPDPAGPPNPTSVFNYYRQTHWHGNVLQRNEVEGIRFGEGGGVTLFAEGAGMEDIIGGETLMFPFFSSPEVFDEAELSVVTDAF